MFIVIFSILSRSAFTIRGLESSSISGFSSIPDADVFSSSCLSLCVSSSPYSPESGSFFCERHSEASDSAQCAGQRSQECKNRAAARKRRLQKARGRGRRKRKKGKRKGEPLGALSWHQPDGVLLLGGQASAAGHASMPLGKRRYRQRKVGPPRLDIDHDGKRSG